MKESTKDKVRGGAREIAGKVKEQTGKIIKNPDLEERGRAQKTAGKVQKKIGDVEKVFED